MIWIEVQSEDIRTRTIKGKKGDFRISEQDAWAFLYDTQGNEDPYPTRITVRLEQDQPGYTHGKYYLAPQSLYVKDRFWQHGYRAPGAHCPGRVSHATLSAGSLRPIARHEDLE